MVDAGPVTFLPKIPKYVYTVTVHVLKDGVLSAFEHHCAGSYNLPITGFILIAIGADLLSITTKHYPMWKKFVNLNFERVS